MLCLERFNKYACRLISNDFNIVSDYNCLLSKAHIRPVYRTTCINRLCLIYKYVNSVRFLPQELITFVANDNARRSARNVTNNRMICIPFVDREKGVKNHLSQLVLNCGIV